MAGILDLLSGGFGGGGGLLSGMLDENQKKQLAMSRMGNFAQGLLNASGPSRMPISFGQAMGQGMQQAGTADDDMMKQLQIVKAMRPDLKLQEIYDPKSPTGTRYVNEQEALGQYGKPSRGTRLSVGANGEISFEEGSGLSLGNPNLAKPTVNKLEEKILDSSEALGRLNNINGTFKPEFLQLGTRAGAKFSEMKDFVGRPLDPTETKTLEEFTVFRQNTTDNLNRLIKDLTGSAMGVQEADRIISTAPNAGSGIFDGDAPTQFKAKLGNATDQTKNAVLRMNWAKTNGMNPLKTGIQLYEVPALIEREGAKIEREIKTKNPNMPQEQVDIQTRLILGKKFGMR